MNCIGPVQQPSVLKPRFTPGSDVRPWSEDM